MKPRVGESWAENTLERASRVGHQLLERTMSRRVEWPAEKQYGTNPVQDPLVYTSLDDAFANMLQYMSTTTRSCQRYYETAAGPDKSGADRLHCRRFHTAQYKHNKHTGNPLQRTEDVHLLVEPGTYAVSAGKWGTSQEHRHVVHVKEGNTVSVDFVM